MTQDLIETLIEEETNLALHTKLCAQRYQQITDKIDNMGRRFDRIETTLTEIKSAVSKDQKDNIKMYLNWAGAIIVMLIAACGYLLSHFVFK